MSFSNKGDPANNKKPSTLGKVTTLNPNAAEFVPFALRSPSGSTGTRDVSASLGASGTAAFGKAVLDRTESSVSNNSDDEAHQFWRHQLPDDITPDFKVTGEDESQRVDDLPFSALSFHEDNDTSRFPASGGGGFMFRDQHRFAPHGTNGNNIAEKLRYSAPSYSEDASSPNYFHLSTKPWDKPIMNNEQLLSPAREGSLFNGNSRHDFLNEQVIVDSSEVNPLEFLAMQFPGFAAESLAEVYFANEGDLNLTIEMLTQLELQVDGGLSQNLNPKTLSAPNLSALDFPVLSVQDAQNGQANTGDETQSLSPYRSSNKENLLSFKSSSSIPTRGAIDFASAVRKMSSQDSGMWKYEGNGSANASVGSSRSSHVLASSYSGGQPRGGMYGDRLVSRTSSRAAPTWLETGEAVANMYSEMREEARDHARLRNAYFEQARQAYLIGNKALAKELSVKGQLHNMHMKAAHGKAQESIYRQRNPGGNEFQGNGRGQEKIIDLHGLHVSEGIHVLKRELSVMRSTARSTDQRIQVYICVGTGHHTRGSRTPARLPVAVQRYLLEEEGLDYSEPQPGLLRVVIY